RRRALDRGRDRGDVTAIAARTGRFRGAAGAAHGAGHALELFLAEFLQLGGLGLGGSGFLLFLFRGSGVGLFLLGRFILLALGFLEFLLLGLVAFFLFSFFAFLLCGLFAFALL